MKKLFISFVLLFSLFIFSQEYQFNYMLKASVKKENPDFNFQSYDMINSKNHSYYMEVYKENNSYKSFLIDNKKKIVHHFKKLNFNRNPITFLHKNSNALSEYSYYDLLKFRIEKTEELSYKIMPEKIINPNDEQLEIKVKLEPFEDDLLIINFELLNYSQILEIENLIKDKLKSENLIGNYYIKEITYRYKKNTILYELITPIKIENHLNLTDNQLNFTK